MREQVRTENQKDGCFTTLDVDKTVLPPESRSHDRRTSDLARQWRGLFGKIIEQYNRFVRFEITLLDNLNGREALSLRIEIEGVSFFYDISVGSAPRDPQGQERIEEVFHRHVGYAFKKIGILRRREQRFRTAADRLVRGIGSGAKLREFRLVSWPFFSDPKILGRLPFEAYIDVLGHNLLPRTIHYRAQKLSELRDNQRAEAKRQRRLAFAVSNRAKNLGKVEADTLAVHLMTTLDVDPADVVKLEEHRVLGFPGSIMVNGGILEQVGFMMREGRITTRFDFEGGAYHSGALIIHRGLPAMGLDSLIGRSVSQIVEGGIFEGRDEKVCSVDAGTGLIVLHLDRSIKLVEVNLRSVE